MGKDCGDWVLGLPNMLCLRREVALTDLPCGLRSAILQFKEHYGQRFRKNTELVVHCNVDGSDPFAGGVYQCCDDGLQADNGK